MKKNKFLAMLLAFAMGTMMLTACGGGKEAAPPADNEAVEETGGEETEKTADVAPDGVDYSAPELVIEDGQFAELNQFAKDLQNYAAEEGMIVRVTGTVSTALGYSLMNVDPENDGSRMGLALTLVGEPAEDVAVDGAVVEATGVVVMGEYVLELSVPAENLKLITPASM